MKLPRLFPYVAAIAALGWIASTSAMAMEAPKPGAAAPDFTVKDLEGKSHKLADFKDKIIVLEWNNFDCPVVAPYYSGGKMPEMQKKYTAAGVIWLTVNSSAEGKQGFYPPAEMKSRAEKEGFAGTAYVYDTSGATGKAYGAPVTPTVVIVGKDGKIAYWGAVDDKHDGGDGSTNHVANALDALLEGKTPSVQSTKPKGCGVKY